jgi:hypothetical protein
MKSSIIPLFIIINLYCSDEFEKKFKDEKIVKKIPIKEFKEKLGEECNNSNDAPVFVLLSKNENKYILKEYNIDDMCALIASYFAYLIKKYLNFPNTPELFIENNYSIQEYIESESSKKQFNEKLKSIEKYKLDELRIFIYIFGIIDPFEDNFIFTNKNIYLIDTDTIGCISFCNFNESPYRILVRNFNSNINEIKHKEFQLYKFKTTNNKKDFKFLEDFLLKKGKTKIIEKLRLSERSLNFIILKENLFLQTFDNNKDKKDLDYLASFPSKDYIYLIRENSLKKIKELNYELLKKYFYLAIRKIEKTIGK